MTRYLSTTAASDDGFTLMELLIAISILAVGLLAIATMQMRSMQVSGYAGDMTAGTTVAQDKLEDLLTRAYDDPALDDVTAVDTNTTVTETSGPFTITTNVDTDKPIVNTKTIEVIVTWSERGVAKTSRIVGVKAAM